MTCEGKDLNNCTEEELLRDVMVHAERYKEVAKSSGGNKGAAEREAAQVSRISKVLTARCGPVVLDKLVNKVRGSRALDRREKI